MTDLQQLPALRKFGTQLAELERQEGQRKRRRRITIFAAALLVPAAGGAAAFAIFKPSPPVTATVGCYADTTQARVLALQPDGRPAVQICQQQWRSGDITGTAVKAPPLTPCVEDVAEPGAMLVFPSADPRVCEQNGLVVAARDVGVGSGPYSRVAKALWATEASCPTVEEARANASRLLGVENLEWRVAAQETETSGDCAVFSFNPKQKTVVVAQDPVRTGK